MTLRLPQLHELAAQLGLKGTSRMRKGELIAAISQATSTSAPNRGQSNDSGGSRARRSRDNEKTNRSDRGDEENEKQDRPRRERKERRDEQDSSDERKNRRYHNEKRSNEEPSEEREGRSQRQRRNDRDRGERTDRIERIEAPTREDDAERGRGRRPRRRVVAGAGAPTRVSDTQPEHIDAKAELMRELAEQTGTPAVEPSEMRQNDRQDNDSKRWDDDDRSNRRRRGRNKRGRDRDRDRDEDRYAQNQQEEVLLPVAGILDVNDNHAYLRTSGYLPGANDVYVSNQLMKSAGLRPGDAITGWVREGGETSNPYGRGRRQNRNYRQKFNPLVSVDTINGMDLERAAQRPEFNKLTPLYPQEQLRLETTPKAVTPRVIDLVAPIGKGQRGLIVSPPKAGKTIVLQQIANAIAVNNPEAHLMVVLVDERPEEVTDMQRTVKGEVIASTFDRPASDHTIVAELAIERAKRLVELGQDVVVLLDSITRLGRAYNLAAPVSGRILSGGVDASALYPPKKFFGAARNVEHGGSLTILATALVETGSKMDEVIFEEFKGTGNMELRLSRQLADKRIFPAVDVAASGTRREELLIDPAQLKIMWKLRRLFSGLEQQQALELVLSKLKDTSSNAEFLMVVSKTTPGAGSNTDE
ncbi:transcription termination factor Rho [Actinomyces vulturis]|uniref:transcription termination factor Rho n=1 Tax=Actinomyces vulturis TaxID=1857645 RepID=UPI003CCBB578